MRPINSQAAEEEFECLPDIAWALVVAAVLPHLIALFDPTTLAKLASCACFPASMGPFALAHIYLLINRLGFTSHMAWISAITFSLIWSGFLFFSWQKNRPVTLVIAVSSCIFSAIWIWLLFAGGI